MPFFDTQKQEDINMIETAQPQAQAANQPYTQSEAGQNSGAQEEAFLTVRYNKEELPLSREAAAEYAQKGLNYDKINGRLKEVSQKIEEYQDLSALAQEMAQKSGLSEKEALYALAQRISEESEKQAAVNLQLDEFIASHPNTDPLTLPESVINAWKSGVPLCDAYAAYAFAEERQTQARQTNAQNAAASMGGAQGTGAAMPRPLSKELIAQMSPAELDKNHSRIWAFLTGQKE